MSTTSIIPTPEQRLKILHVYGEKGDRLVREKERKYITTMSRSTAWKLEKAGKFPRRKSLGAKSCGWLLSDLLYWINKK